MQDDPVESSLARVAEHHGDIAPEVYRRFAASRPQWAALMDHMDDYMIGRMMQDVLVLLMTAPPDLDRHYLNFEVASHRNYGVTAEMFPPLLEAVRDTLREHLADAWTGPLQNAWQQRIDALTLEIEQAARRPPAAS